MPSFISRKSFLQLSAGCAGSAVVSNFPFTSNSTRMAERITDPGIIFRNIPSTGEALPAIGMGTWLTFDAGNSGERRKNLKEVLRIFQQTGGKLVDSSPMYGTSETVAGDLTEELDIRKKLFVASKVWTNGKEAGVSQMQRSSERMKAGIMDLMQVHNLVDAEVHLNTLKTWKSQGKIRYFGITHYMVSAYPDLIKIIGDHKPDFVQFNYNIRVRDGEHRLLPFCQDKGVAVICNRPFDGGDLFSTVKNKALPGWAAEFGARNWAQFFLKFIISHPAVTCAIPATSRPEHMTENMGALLGRLPDAATRKNMAEYFDKV